MNKNIFLFLFISMTFCFGCRTIKPSDYELTDTTRLKLPKLVPEVNLKNLESVISNGHLYSSGEAVYTVIADRAELLDYCIKTEYVPEKRNRDIIKTYGNIVRCQISDTTAPVKGSIKMNLLSFRVRKNPFLTFYSVWTLCATSLVGVPVTSITTKLETKVAIYDKSGRVVRTYIGKGKGTTFIALYWGYGNDGRRKSAILAFQKAMKKIIDQIETDKVNLLPLLNSR